MNDRIILKQDRPFYSKVSNAAVAGEQTLKFFTTAGFSDVTNLDVAQQISNSGSYEIRVLQIAFSKSAPFAATDLADISQIIDTGVISLNVNQVNYFRAALAQILKIPATPLTSGALPNVSESLRGSFIFNLPIEIPKGAPFELAIRATFPAVAYKILCVFNGFLSTEQ